MVRMFNRLGIFVGAAAAAAALVFMGQTVSDGSWGGTTGGATTSFLAACQDTVNPDSASLSCSPQVIASNDGQLTEAEVAEPGFNASPGDHGEAPGSGGHGGK